MAYESYYGTPVVFFDHAQARIWEDDTPEEYHYREIYEAEAR
jgi:hypothetical protein